MKGYKFIDPKILELADINGITVAHRMARNSHKFTDPEILKLADNRGRTVEDIMNR